MQRIEFSKSLETVEERAFMGCKGLSEIYFRGVTPPCFGTQVFSGCADEVVVYVLSHVAVSRYREVGVLTDMADAIIVYDSDI